MGVGITSGIIYHPRDSLQDRGRVGLPSPEDVLWLVQVNEGCSLSGGVGVVFQGSLLDFVPSATNAAWKGISC